jgi:elongation factor G
MADSHLQPHPVLSVAVRPKRNHDWSKLQRVLESLVQEDQALRASSRPDRQQIILGGMAELHLELICHRLAHEFEIPLDVGSPEIVYLETIRKSAEAEGKYIRQCSGRGVFAHVQIGLKPGRQGSGYHFVDNSSASGLPPGIADCVDAGIQEGLKAGGMHGHEIVDVQAVFYGGSYHPEDSSEMAFKIAAAMACQEAARRASPVTLEPVMSMEVVTSEEWTGLVVGDLSLREGRIEGIEAAAGSVAVRATAPLRRLLGYTSHLRTATAGRGSYFTNFARYQPRPDRDESRPDEIGVIADQPKGPPPRAGSVSATPEE